MNKRGILNKRGAVIASVFWSAVFLPGILLQPVQSEPGTAPPITKAAQLEGPARVGFSGALPNLKNVEIENSHVYDYTFSTAPTDWWVQSGIWEMTNRWACSPGWSWFGGRSDGEGTATVWNKRRFKGDISLQFYFAFKHALPHVPKQWHYRLADAAVTICGDGKNLDSGYTMILGADNNTRSLFLRGNAIISESRTPDAILPTIADGYPQNAKLLHHRWWYVRINKTGPRVECWLDNKLLFSYNDPKPLDVGQIALWTYNNGIMLSRVQIYYANEQRPVLVKTPKKPASKATQLAHLKN